MTAGRRDGTSQKRQRGEPTLATHTRRVAEFAAGLDADAVPSEVIDHAKLDILDTIGCALYGRTRPIAHILEAALRPGDDNGVAGVWGSRWHASPATAALVNGTLTHSFELDDLHHVAILHPGGTTLPATTAAAELTGTVTGLDLVLAHVAGLEISSRVGLAVGVPLLMRGWHNNGVLGVFGAAAGTARALGLTAAQTHHAIGVAGSLAAGLMAAQYGAMVKRLHAGNAAQVGLRAALLAREGFTGIDALFEEPYGGFFTTFADDHAIEEVDKDLGTRWETLAVGFKPYSCCGSSHSTVSLLLKMREEHRLAAGDIARVRIGCSTATRDHVGWRYVPGSATTAQMNLPYAASVAILDGACFVEQFADERLADPEVLELSQKIVVEAEPQIDEKGRGARHEVNVTVDLSDGRSLSGFADAAPGSSRYPLSANQVTDKFLRLANYTIGEATAQRVVDLVRNLDRCDDLQALWTELKQASSTR